MNWKRYIILIIGFSILKYCLGIEGVIIIGLSWLISREG